MSWFFRELVLPRDQSRLFAAAFEVSGADSDVARIWQRIEAALAKRAPAVLANLQGPASEEEIRTFETELGVDLPQDLRQSLMRHNGQPDVDWDRFLFCDFPYFSIDHMYDARDLAKEVAWSFGALHEVDDLIAWKCMVEDGIGFIDGPVKACYFNPHWVCIGSNGNTCRYIDLDPPTGGTHGQIIEVCPTAVRWRVIAPTFELFLSTFAEGLESGAVDWAGDKSGSGDQFPPARSSIPDYLRDVDWPVAKHRDELDPVDLEAIEVGGVARVQAEVIGLMGTFEAMRLTLQITNPMAGRTDRGLVAGAARDDTEGYAQIHINALGRCELIYRQAKPMGLNEPPTEWVVGRFQLLREPPSIAEDWAQQ